MFILRALSVGHLCRNEWSTVLPIQTMYSSDEWGRRRKREPDQGLELEQAIRPAGASLRLPETEIMFWWYCC